MSNGKCWICGKKGPVQQVRTIVGKKVTVCAKGNGCSR